jgi:predicted permease
MWNNFVYSVNVILPIFILVMLGWLLKRFNFFKEGFLESADKMVFKIMLPCMLFIESSKADLRGGSGQMSFILFGCAGISVSFLILWLIIPVFVKDDAKRGAMIQGSFRSNFTILGVPLAASMFGEKGSIAIAVLTPFIILLVNIYSVIILSVFAPHGTEKSIIKIAGRIAKSTLTNPLIIAVVLALPFMLTDISLPVFAEKTLSYLSQATVALSLISLGAGITGSAIKGKIKYSLAATFIKTVLLPAVMVAIAYIFGFRNTELGVLFILFGTPSAVASYIMAKNMKSDDELAGQILLLTTMFCLITIFAGIFVMKNIGCI